jgi:hypothetical protein
VIVRKFRRNDLAALPVQTRQRATLALLDAGSMALIDSGPAYTLDDDGPKACAGIAYTETAPVAWAWLAEDAPMLALHRYVKAALAAVPYCMAYAALDWPQAVRWLELLGFEPTGEQENLGGSLHGLFVRYG